MHFKSSSDSATGRQCANRLTHRKDGWESNRSAMHVSSQHGSHLARPVGTKQQPLPLEGAGRDAEKVRQLSKLGAIQLPPHGSVSGVPTGVPEMTNETED